MSYKNPGEGFTSPGRKQSVSKSFYFGLFTLAAGVIVLLGWLFDIPSLKSVLPWFVTMKANTAVGFVLAGFSLTLLARASPSALELRLSQISACVTALIGFLTICQYLFDLNLGIDQMLFREPASAVGPLPPGQMALNTAINFLILGYALFTVNYRRGIAVAQELALLTAVMGLFPLIGYIYGVTGFIGIGQYTQMAVHTAFLFTVVSVGVLALHPEDGLMRTITGHTMGGWLLRHLLPLLIVPIILGWLQIKGERHGYFENAFGIALMVICMILLLAGFIWWAARELNRFEESLRRKDYFLSESQRLGHVGSFLWDMTGKISWSDETYRLFGVSPDTFTPSEESFFSLIHPEDRPSMREWITACAAGKKPDALEFRINRPDGTIRYIQGCGEAVYDAENKLMFMAGTAQDITERKREEDALQASEREFRSLAEAMPQIVWVTRPDGWNIYFNQQWVDYTGLTLEQSYGHGWNTPFHPDDRQHAWDAWVNATQHNGIYSIESRLRRADGVYRWWLVRGVPIHDANGKILKWFGTCTDIEDIKLAEEELRESGRFAQATVDALSAHIAVLDDTGTIIAVNRAWRAFAEANGPLLSNVNEGANCLSVCDALSGPDSREAASVAAGIRAVISGAKSTFEIEYSCHSPNTKRWFVCRLSRFPGQGSPKIVYAHENITERILLEKEKAKIEELNRQLQKNESLGRMAGSIAHQFNNQLSVVMGYLQMVIGDMPISDSRTVKLTRAMQAAREASEVSALLLTYLGQKQGKFELTDLAELCRTSLPLLQAGKPENVTLETDLSTPVPGINADAKHIQQVLTKLITNAWEAIGNGAGTIHLSVKTVSLTDIPASHRFPIDWVSKEQNYACLEVMDSGCGILENDMDKLFEPFYTTKFTGRGLGLPVVLGILKAHDAVITVESRINGGSAFKVFFPLSSETAPSPNEVVFSPLI